MTYYPNIQADRAVGRKITSKRINVILETVFTEILPEWGFKVRDEQIALALHILFTLEHHGVTLAEAEVGIGKTLAYLIAAILVKRGRLNDDYNACIYPDMQYADMSKMPVVITTSSIALQRAIMTEYIPQLSKILLESGVIRTPITAVLRKGKDNYICQRKLKTYMSVVVDRKERQMLERILNRNFFDFAELDGFDITPKTKQSISVSGRCFDTCPNRDKCRYFEYREQAQSLDVDIYVSNHNFFIADTIKRSNNSKHQQPLIPNYQMLIIDEAHKLLSAARSMYGIEFSSETAPELAEMITDINFSREELKHRARKAAGKLRRQNKKLFKLLSENRKNNDDDIIEESSVLDRAGVEINEDIGKCLKYIRNIADDLVTILEGEVFCAKCLELLSWVQGEYGADIPRTEFNRLMPVPETGKDSRKSQVYSIYNEICNLKAIKHLVNNELVRNNHKNKHNDIEPFSKIKKTIWKNTQRLFRTHSATGKKSEWLIRLLWQITQLRDQTAELSKYKNLICWHEVLENNNCENKLCAIPKNLGERLFSHQWSKKIPTLLTSGTLSAAGDFTHIKQALGLNYLNSRFLSETTHPSPFNYRKNALLYISENMPFPDQKNQDYINAVAVEVDKLILASHSHAAVLFTSYKVMDLVWEKLHNKLPFPLFRLDKGGIKEIERFKHSDGGVLFASGAMWEGIDIPGDALSMLIIVKLPFAVPDPISEYEQTQYPDFNTYRNSIIVPEMLVKLKQGFGRLIRTETDSGVVAILDSRVNSTGGYRERVLSALPHCRVTSDIEEISEFMVTKKSIDYFDKDFHI